MATDILDLSYTKSSVMPTSWDAPLYEHKKFSKRRRSVACHCENSGNTCTLDNCNKYKYFAAISMNNIAIYNSVEGTYELIDTREIMQNNSLLELKARNTDNNKRKQQLDAYINDDDINDDADAQYEYIKADTDTNDEHFIGNHLPHLHYIIRRTQRRRCS